jgi:hypothetical protein
VISWAITGQLPTRMLSHNIFCKKDNRQKQAACFSSPLASVGPPCQYQLMRRVAWSMPTSGKPDMGCRRSGWWGCPTLFFQKRHQKSSKQLISHLLLAPAIPPHRHPSPSISIDGEGFRACPHLERESRIWAAVEVADGAVTSSRRRIDPTNPEANRGWLWNAILLDRRGHKGLTQRWQGLALAGGNGHSHGSCGHHGDGVLCWSTLCFFRFGREERWKNHWLS